MDTPLDGKQIDSGGSGATANPSEPTAQLSPADLVEMKRQVVELVAQNRGLQKGLDKRLANDVLPLLKRVAERLGIDEAKVLQAQRDEVLDGLVAERLGTPIASQTPGTSTAVAPQIEVTKIAAMYGLDANDASFIAGLASETDPDKVELAVARRAKQKQNQPSPTAAQSTAPAGGHASAEQDEAQLKAEYQKAIKPLRGNIDAISRLQAEYRKKGLPL